MTNVTTLASQRAGLHVQPSAPFLINLTQVPDTIASHQHVICAISTATGHLHHGRTETGLHSVAEMEEPSHD